MGKKSERFEIRMSHDEKRGFVEACERQGEVPSHAVRRFARSYIRRAQGDELGFAARSFLRRARAPLAVLGVAGLGVAGAGVAIGDTLDARADAAHVADVFARFDANGSGALEPGEVAPRDEGLFHVLDLDDDGLITLSEYQPSVWMTVGWTKGSAGRAGASVEELTCVFAVMDGYHPRPDDGAARRLRLVHALPLAKWQTSRASAEEPCTGRLVVRSRETGRVAWVEEPMTDRLNVRETAG